MAQEKNASFTPLVEVKSNPNVEVEVSPKAARFTVQLKENGLTTTGKPKVCHKATRIVMPDGRTATIQVTGWIK